MAERDAFGREKDENTFQGLGWTSSGETRSTDTPVPVSRETLPGMDADVNHDGIPGSHAPPPRAYADRPQSSGGGMPDDGRVDLGPLATVAKVVFRRLLPFAVVLAILGGVGAGIVGAISDAVDDIETSSPEFPQAPVIDPEIGQGADDEPSGAAVEQDVTPPAEPAGPPEGLQRGSLLLASNFAAVKAKMRTGRYGRLKNLSIRPERVNAQFVTEDGQLRNVTFLPGGQVEAGSLSGSGFGSLPTLAIGPINSAAPYRMARSAAGRLKRDDTAVNYVVYYGEDFVGDLVWGVYMKNGEIFQGDTRGRILRQIG